MGKIEDVPKRAVSEVLASTSQVTSGSGDRTVRVKKAVALVEISTLREILY